MISEEPKHREHAFDLLTIVWDMSEEKIDQLVELNIADLTPLGQRQLESSINGLKRVIGSISSQSGYLESEQEDFVGDLLLVLQRSFRKLYKSFVSEEVDRDWRLNRTPRKPLNPDLGFIQRVFTKIVQTKMKLPKRKKVMSGSSSITYVIRYIRNIHEHQDELPEGELPIDFITGIRTCGNIYTFVSMLIISIHAYIEVLELWEKVS